MSESNPNEIFESKWKKASIKLAKNIIGGFGIGLCLSLLVWSIIII